jgi:hypothetical protein
VPEPESPPVATDRAVVAAPGALGVPALSSVRAAEARTASSSSLPFTATDSVGSCDSRLLSSAAPRGGRATPRPLVIDRPAVTAPSASASSPMVPKRSAGALASARSTMASTAAGTSGSPGRRLGGVCPRMAESRSNALFSMGQGILPASSS